MDWRQSDLSDYYEAREAYDEAHDPDAKEVKEPTPELKRFFAAHGGNVAAGSE